MAKSKNRHKHKGFRFSVVQQIWRKTELLLEGVREGSKCVGEEGELFSDSGT